MGASVVTVPIPDAQAMRASIDSYIAMGFSVASQDATSTTMVKRKEFQAIWAVVGFLLCLIPLLIYLIVYSTQSDQMVRLVITGAAGPAAVGAGQPAALNVSTDGHWWWSDQRQAWVGVLESLPPGTQVSADQKWWWDGTTWRAFPAPGDSNSDGRVTTSDAGAAPQGFPAPTNSTTVVPRPGDPLPPPRQQ